MKTNQIDIYFITVNEQDLWQTKDFQAKMTRKDLEVILLSKEDTAMIQKMKTFHGYHFIKLKWIKN